jgi:PKD repeat protein
MESNGSENTWALEKYQSLNYKFLIDDFVLKSDLFYSCDAVFSYTMVQNHVRNNVYIYIYIYIYSFNVRKLNNETSNTDVYLFHIQFEVPPNWNNINN